MLISPPYTSHAVETYIGARGDDQQLSLNKMGHFDTFAAVPCSSFDCRLSFLHLLVVSTAIEASSPDGWAHRVYLRVQGALD